MNDQQRMSRPLADSDPEIYEAIRAELERQDSHLELIASETELTRGATGFNAIQRPFHDLVSTRQYNFVLLGLVLAAGLLMGRWT